MARPGARAGVLRVPRARPVRRRAVDRRPEAPAGPHRADRRQDRVPQGPPRLRRGRPPAERPSSTRRSRSPSRPATRPSLAFDDDDAAGVPSAADGSNGRPSKPVDGQVRRARRVRARPRRGRDRRDHVVHQHLQPVGDARRRAAGQERRREGPDVQAVGEDHAGARARKVVTDYYDKAGLWPVPGEARLLPGRLRLHHLHRQLRPAARRDLARPSTTTTSSSPRCSRATATSRAASTPTSR